MSEENERLKTVVREAYTKAVEATAPSGSCCSGGSDRPTLVQIGERASAGRYAREDLAALPEGLAGSSFGCGNPLALAGLREGQTVLDLGSGAGLDALLAARMVGPTGRVVGLDMTDAMLERARENARKAGLSNVDFRKGDIEAVPLEDASVDLVVSNCVLNLVPDKAKAFREIARVLRPGGRISISDIVVSDDVGEELRSLASVYAACVGGAISEERYVALLREAGLEDVRIADRLVYDEDHVRSLVADAVVAEFPGGERDAIAAEAARRFGGHVASVRVVGRRPGGA